MAGLTEPEKREIVTRLACFEGISEIIADFRERGLELHHKQVGGYDPTKSYFEAGEWARELFIAKRKTYVEDASAIPIANRAFRLNELQGMLQKAKRSRNWKLAADLIEQASKEVGGAYSNIRELDIRASRRPADLSPEDRNAQFVELIRQAIEQMPADDAEPQRSTH